MHSRADTSMHAVQVQVLETIVQELRSELWKFMVDRFATHVARRVLCLLCGHDVLPSSNK